MLKRLILLIAVLAVSAVMPAVAVDVLGVDVKMQDRRYVLRGESIIYAPRDFVHQILTDYENFHHLASGISETKFLPPRDGFGPLAYTRVDSCVLFFCRKLIKIEELQKNTVAEVVTVALPEESDFKFNWTRWTLQGVANGTRVVYEAEIEPDFWIPPLIGSWAIKRKLQVSAEEMGARIEYLSKTGKPISALAAIR